MPNHAQKQRQAWSRTRTRSRGRHGGVTIRYFQMAPRALSLALSTAFAAGTVWANPQGAQVVQGQATFQTQGNRLTVTNTPGTAINWQSFSIRAGETTYFQQQNAASAVLNRVVTNNPSQIYGTLGSNGQVILVNPAGITVGRGAVVDTAGFTASTLAIHDADFKAGRLRFQGNALSGSVQVDGVIRSSNGDVMLFAPQVGVGKDAVVRADNGNVIVGAGQKVEVTGRGLEGIRFEIQAADHQAVNLGTLQGNAVGVFAGSLRHSGVIRAQTATMEGGRVVLRAIKDVKIDAGAQVLADGGVNAQGVPQKGGQITVSSAQGQITIGSAATLSAQGAPGAAGGSMAVQAEQGSVQIERDARLSADGSPGGSIRIEAAQQLSVAAQLSARSPVGAAGISGAGISGAGTSVQPVSAQAPVVAKGGQIDLFAEHVQLASGATVDVSGDAGGGQVRVGGDFQGANPLVRNASTTDVAPGVIINADGRAVGDGGRVIVWADEATHFAGTITARGGEGGGDGGFAETSGKKVLYYRGRVNLGAPRGRVGTLLLDPDEITISGSSNGNTLVTADGSDPDSNPIQFSQDGAGTIFAGTNSGGYTVTESELEGTTASVLLQANHRILAVGQFDQGDIHMANGASLTLQVVSADTSGDGINLTSSAQGTALKLRTSNGGSITLEALGLYGNVSAGNLHVSGNGSVSVFGGGTVSHLGSISTESGGVSLTASGGLSAGIISTTGGAVELISLSKGVTLNGAILSNGGAITVNGASITSAAAALSAGTGAVALSASAAGGVDLQTGSSVQGKTVLLQADRIQIAPGASLSASDRVTLRAFGNARTTNIGFSDATIGSGFLGLTQGEFNAITAPVLQVGDATSGDIYFSGPGGFTQPATVGAVRFQTAPASGRHIEQTNSLSPVSGSAIAFDGEVIYLNGGAANSIASVAAYARSDLRLDLADPGGSGQTIKTIDGVIGLQAGNNITLSQSGGVSRFITLEQDVKAQGAINFSGVPLLVVKGNRTVRANLDSLGGQDGRVDFGNAEVSANGVAWLTVDTSSSTGNGGDIQNLYRASNAGGSFLNALKLRATGSGDASTAGQVVLAGDYTTDKVGTGSGIFIEGRFVAGNDVTLGTRGASTTLSAGGEIRIQGSMSGPGYLYADAGTGKVDTSGALAVDANLGGLVVQGGVVMLGPVAVNGQAVIKAATQITVGGDLVASYGASLKSAGGMSVNGGIQTSSGHVDLSADGGDVVFGPGGYVLSIATSQGGQGGDIYVQASGSISLSNASYLETRGATGWLTGVSGERGGAGGLISLSAGGNVMLPSGSLVRSIGGDGHNGISGSFDSSGGGSGGSGGRGGDIEIRGVTLTASGSIASQGGRGGAGGDGVAGALGSGNTGGWGGSGGVGGQGGNVALYGTTLSVGGSVHSQGGDGGAGGGGGRGADYDPFSAGAGGSGGFGGTGGAGANGGAILLQANRLNNLMDVSSHGGAGGQGGAGGNGGNGADWGNGGDGGGGGMGGYGGYGGQISLSHSDGATLVFNGSRIESRGGFAGNGGFSGPGGAAGGGMGSFNGYTPADGMSGTAGYGSSLLLDAAGGIGLNNVTIHVGGGTISTSNAELYLDAATVIEADALFGNLSFNLGTGKFNMQAGALVDITGPWNSLNIAAGSVVVSQIRGQSMSITADTIAAAGGLPIGSTHLEATGGIELGQSTQRINIGTGSGDRLKVSTSSTGGALSIWGKERVWIESDSDLRLGTIDSSIASGSGTIDIASAGGIRQTYGYIIGQGGHISVRVAAVNDITLSSESGYTISPGGAGGVSLSSTSGNIELYGHVLADSGDIRISAGGALDIGSASLLSSTSGRIELDAGNLYLDGSVISGYSGTLPPVVIASDGMGSFNGTVSAGSGMVVFMTREAGRALEVLDLGSTLRGGGPPTTLQIDSTALQERVLAGTLQLGNANMSGGDVYFDVGYSPAAGAAQTLHVYSGGSISQAADAEINVNAAAFKAATGVSLSSATNTIGTFAGAITTSGDFDLRTEAGTAGSVGGLAGVTTVAGSNIVLSGRSALTIASSLNAGNGSTSDTNYVDLTVDSGGTLTIQSGAIVSGHEAPDPLKGPGAGVYIEADDLVLNGTLNARGTGLVLTPASASRAVVLGGTATPSGGELHISGAELGRITGASTLHIGSVDYSPEPLGDVLIDGPVSLGSTVLSIYSDGLIHQSTGATLGVAGLNAQGARVELTQDNQITGAITGGSHEDGFVLRNLPSILIGEAGLYADEYSGSGRGITLTSVNGGIEMVAGSNGLDNTTTAGANALTGRWIGTAAQPLLLSGTQAYDLTATGTGAVLPQDGHVRVEGYVGDVLRIGSVSAPSGKSVQIKALGDVEGQLSSIVITGSSTGSAHWTIASAGGITFDGAGAIAGATATLEAGGAIDSTFSSAPVAITTTGTLRMQAGDIGGVNSEGSALSFHAPSLDLGLTTAAGRIDLYSPTSLTLDSLAISTPVAAQPVSIQSGSTLTVASDILLADDPLTLGGLSGVRFNKSGGLGITGTSAGAQLILDGAVTSASDVDLHIPVSLSSANWTVDSGLTRFRQGAALGYGLLVGASGSVSVAGGTLGAGSLDNAGWFELAGGSAQLTSLSSQSGTLMVGAGDTLTVSASHITNTGSVAGAGTIALSPGYALINQGVIAPGGVNATGTLTVQGNVILQDGSQLVIELGGEPASGLNDKLVISGDLSSENRATFGTPAGTLFIAEAGSYRSGSGRTYPILSVGGAVAPQFEAIVLPNDVFSGSVTPVGSTVLLSIDGVVTRWIDTGSGAWADAAKWTRGTPTASDDAVIDAASHAAQVTLSSGASVRNLTVSGDDTLHLVGGSLSFVQGGTIGSTAALVMDGGLLGGGNLDVNGQWRVISGMLADSGVRTVATGATLTISGSGTLSIKGGAELHNDGVVEFTSDGTIGALDNGGGGTLSQHSGGLVRKTGGSGMARYGVLGAYSPLAVNLQGTVESASGELALLGTNTLDGVTFASGAGSVRIRNQSTLSGTLTAQAGAQVIIDAVSGGINGYIDGTAVLAGNYQWVSGYLAGSAQITTIGTLDIGAGSLSLDSGAKLDNSGRLRVGDGTVYIYGGSALTNSGVLEFTGDGSILSVHASGWGTLTNQAGALLLKSGGTLSSAVGRSTSSSGVYVINSGTLEAQSGELSLAGHVSLLDGTLFRAGQYNLQSDAAFNGTITAESGATVRIDAGDITGVARLQGAGRYDWVYGILTGATTSITSAGATDVSSWLELADGARLDNTGTLSMADGAGIGLSGDAYLGNSGTLKLDGSAYVRAVILASNGTVSNSGRILKTAGTLASTLGYGTTGAQISFINSGTVESLGGELSITATTTLNDGSLLMGGTIRIAAPSATLSGTITAAPSATVVIDAGTLSGIATLAGDYSWANGEITGNSSAITTSGAISGNSGTLAVTDGAQLVNNGGITLSGSASVRLDTSGRLHNNSGLSLGDGNLMLAGDARLENTSTISLTGDAQIIAIASAGVGTLHNATGAVIEKTGGTGESLIGDQRAGGAAVRLQNDGTLHSASGSMRYAGLTTLYGGSRFEGSGGHTVAGGSQNAGTITAATGATITFGSGLITGNFTLDGRFNLHGATLDGSGSLTNLGTLDINSGAVVTLQAGHQLTNTGTLRLGGNTVALGGGAVITNDGLLQMDGLALISPIASAGTGTLSNSASGVIRKVGTGTAIIGGNPGGGAAIDLIHNGTLTVFGGALDLQGGGFTQAGLIEVGAGTTLKRSGGFTSTGLIQGTGTIDLGTGTLVNNGTLAPGGAGVGTLTVLGGLNLATGTVLIDAASNSSHDRIAVSGSLGSGGSLSFTELGSTFVAGGDVYDVITYGGSFSGTLPTLSASIVDTTMGIGTTAASNGALRVQPTSVINRWLSDSSGNWNQGTLWSRGHAPNEFEDAVIDRASANPMVSITAGGKARTISFGTGANDSLSLQGGSFVLGSGGINVPANSVLDVQGGKLEGSGHIVIDGALNWSGGELAGTGTLAINSGGQLNLSGGATAMTLSRQAYVSGTGYMDAGVLTLNSGAQLRLMSGSSTTLFSADPSDTINGTGTLHVQTGASLSFNTGTRGNALPVQATLVNDGGLTLTTTSGLALNAGATHSGSFVLGGSTDLVFAGGAHTLSGTSGVTGGRLRVDGADVTAQAPLAVDILRIDSGSLNYTGVQALNMPAFDMTGGTATLGSVAIGISDWNQSGGSVSASGPLVVTNSFQQSAGSLLGLASADISHSAGTLQLASLSSSGSMRLLADGLQLSGPVSGGSIQIAPYSSAYAVRLGSTAVAGTLGITSASLGQLSTTALTIGDAATGRIDVAAAVSVPSGTALTLHSGSTVAALGGGVLSADRVALVADRVDLTAAAQQIGEVAGTVTNANGAFSLLNGRALTVGSVGGLLGVATQGDDSLGGAIQIAVTGGTLSVQQPITVTANAGGQRSNITLRAADIDIGSASATMLSGGAMTLQAHNGTGAVSALLGGTANQAGRFVLTTGEVGRISAPDGLALAQGASGIEVAAALAPQALVPAGTRAASGVGSLTLDSSANVLFSGTGSVAAPSVLVQAAGGVSSTSSALSVVSLTSSTGQADIHAGSGAIGSVAAPITLYIGTRGTASLSSAGSGSLGDVSVRFAGAFKTSQMTGLDTDTASTQTIAVGGSGAFTVDQAIGAADVLRLSSGGAFDLAVASGTAISAPSLLIEAGGAFTSSGAAAVDMATPGTAQIKALGIGSALAPIVVNAGSLGLQSTGTLASGDIYFASTGALNLGSTGVVTDTLSAQAVQAQTAAGFGISLGAGVLTNDHLVLKTGADIVLNGSGTLSAASISLAPISGNTTGAAHLQGTLTLQTPVLASLPVVVDSGASVVLGTGGGTATTSLGTLTLLGDLTTGAAGSVTTLNLQGGNLSVSAGQTLAASAALNWSQGHVLGDGTLNVPGVLRLSGALDRRLEATLNHSNTSGASLWSVPPGNNGTLFVQEGGAFINASGARLLVNVPPGQNAVVGAASTDNTGRFTNSGQVTVQGGGTLVFAGGGAAVNGLDQTGSGQLILNNSTLRMGDGASAPSASGQQGQFVLQGTLGGAALELDGANRFSSSSTLLTSGATRLLSTANSTLASFAASSWATVAVPSGTLTIDQMLSVSGALDLAGTVSGSGGSAGLTLGSGVLATLGSAPALLGLSVNNQSGLTLASGTTLQMGSSFTNGGHLIMAGGTLSGSALSLTNTGTISGSGTLNLGTGTLLNSGTLSPGGAGTIGTLAIGGNLNLGTGLVQVELASPSSHDRISLAGSGVLTTGGTLQVSELSPFISASDRFDIIGFNTVSGASPVVSSAISGVTLGLSTTAPGSGALRIAPSSVANLWLRGSGNWSDGTKWSRGHAPVAGESVTVSPASVGLVTLGSGVSGLGLADLTLGSDDVLVIDGGSLVLPTVLTAPGALRLVSGSLAGSGGAFALGNLDWQGGSFGGSGNFTLTSFALNGGGSRSLDGASLGGSALTLNGGTLQLNSGGMYFTVSSVAAGATLAVGAGTLSTGNLINNGRLSVLSAATAPLSVSALGTHAGAFDIAAGRTLALTGAGVTLASGASVTGGTLEVPTGTLLQTLGAIDRGTGAATRISGGLLQADASFTTPTLEVTGGGVTGSGNLAVTQAFSQSGGAIGTGFGTLSINQASGDLSVGQFGAKTAITLAAPTGSLIDANGATSNVSAPAAQLSAANGIDLDLAVNTLAATANGATDLSNTKALSVSTLATGTGNLVLSTAGAISQTGALQIGGTARLSANGLSVTLPDTGNSFGGTVTLLSTGATDVRSAGALGIEGAASSLTAYGSNVTLGALTLPGAMTINASGTLTQSAAVNVTGLSSLTGSAGINLPQANTFGGGVQFSSSGNIGVRSAGALAVSGTAGGALSVFAGGDITQSGVVGAGGQVALYADGFAVNLGGFANSIADLNVTRAASATVRSNRSLLLAGTVTGALALDLAGGATGAATAGSFALSTRSAASTVNVNLTVPGSVSFATNGGSYSSITYRNNASGSLLGPITTSGLLSIDQAVGGVVLPTLNAGSLIVGAPGAITQSGVLTTGAASFATSGAAISLPQAGNRMTTATVTGSSATLVDAGALRVEGAVSGTLSVTAAAISSTNGLQAVSGVFTASTGSLQLGGNTQLRTLAANAGGAVNVNNFSNGLELGNVTAGTSMALSSAGAITQAAGGGVSTPSLLLAAPSIGTPTAPVVLRRSTNIGSLVATGGGAWLSTNNAVAINGNASVASRLGIVSQGFGLNGVISAQQVDINAGTGNLTLGGGAVASGIATSGSVSLIGRDVTLGSAIATQPTEVVADGAISVDASGNFILRGGSASGAHVKVEAFGAATFKVAGTLSVLGGSGANAYALLDPRLGEPMVITAAAVNVAGGDGQKAFGAIVSDGDITFNSPSLSLVAGNGSDADAVVYSYFGKVSLPASCIGCTSLNAPGLSDGLASTGVLGGDTYIALITSSNLGTTQLVQATQAVATLTEDPTDQSKPATVTLTDKDKKKKSGEEAVQVEGETCK